MLLTTPKTSLSNRLHFLYLIGPFFEVAKLPYGLAGNGFNINVEYSDLESRFICTCRSLRLGIEINGYH